MKDYVGRLTELSSARMKESREWERRFQLVKLCREASERKTVPLERSARKKMMKEDREVFDEADGLELDGEELTVEIPLDDKDKSKEAAKDGAAEKQEQEEAEPPPKDIVLDEAMNILADLVRLTDGAEAPAPQPQPSRIPAWLRALGNGQ